jgi:hypothetical protein
MPCVVNKTADTAVAASSKTNDHVPQADAIPEQLLLSIAKIGLTISAVVMNADAALRLLRDQPPDTEGIRRLLACIVNDGIRTGDIVNRARALSKKATPR